MVSFGLIWILVSPYGALSIIMRFYGIISVRMCSYRSYASLWVLISFLGPHALLCNLMGSNWSI